MYRIKRIRMKLSELLPIMAAAYYEKTERFPTKTALLKLCYLADVEHVSHYGHRLLDDEWVYFHYGPYVHGYDDLLDRAAVDRRSGTTSSGHDFETIAPSEDFKEPQLSFDLKRLVRSIVAGFGSLDLNSLLDYVYFDTEPMITVSHQGETLDFDTIRPAEDYRIKTRSISPKKLAAFRKKYREKAKLLER